MALISRTDILKCACVEFILSMRTEGIKAFSKRIRCCSADGRKRYENDLWTQIFLKTKKKIVPFSFENGFSVSSTSE